MTPQCLVRFERGFHCNEARFIAHLTNMECTGNYYPSCCIASDIRATRKPLQEKLEWAEFMMLQSCILGSACKFKWHLPWKGHFLPDQISANRMKIGPVVSEIQHLQDRQAKLPLKSSAYFRFLSVCKLDIFHPAIIY